MPDQYDNLYTNVEGPIVNGVRGFQESTITVLDHHITSGPTNDSDFQGPLYSIELSFRQGYNFPLGGALSIEYNAGFPSKFPWLLKVVPDTPSTGQMQVQLWVGSDACPSAIIFIHNMTMDPGWHLLTVTYNTSGNATMYVDGAQTNQIAAPCANLFTTTNTAVGLPQIIPSAFDVAEVLFYKTELSSARVAAHYTAWSNDKAARDTAVGYPKNDPYLFFWYDASQLTGLSDGSPVAGAYQHPLYASSMTDFSGRRHNLDTNILPYNSPIFHTNVKNGLPIVRMAGNASQQQFIGLFTDQEVNTGSYTIHTAINPTTLDTGVRFHLGILFDGDQNTDFWVFLNGDGTYLSGLISGSITDNSGITWGFFDGTNVVNAPALTGWQILTVRLNTSTLITDIFRNGTLLASGPYVGGLHIGLSPTLWGGEGGDDNIIADWGEATVFIKAQSNTEVATEVARLNAKWAIF